MKPKAGRPLSQATRAKRESEKLWTENRPAFVVDGAQSDLLKHLINGDAFKSVRRGLGLGHKSISDDLVLDALWLIEGESVEFEKTTNDELTRKKFEIHTSSKKGGQKVPTQTMRLKIDEHLNGRLALNEFFEGKMSYKKLHIMLKNLRLPDPDDRTLRRWKKSEIGH